MAREMNEHELISPVDISEEPLDEGRSLVWTTMVIAVAAFVLLFANAGTLAAWIDEKPVSEAQQRASDLANGWSASLDALGVTKPRDELHRLWKTAQAARFGNEAAGQ